MATSVPAEAQGPSQPSPPSPEQIYRALHSYPFARDADYQSGLSAILGHAETPATPDELVQKSSLVLQAQCFYFARKFNVPPIDAAGYAAWLGEQEGSTQSGAGQQVRNEDTATSAPFAGVERAATDIPSSTPLLQDESAAQPPPSSPPQEEPPPYPTSFAAIVDLITRNIPVPGIEEIPTTVLEHGSSKIDKTPRRRKPWEKDADADVDFEDEEKQLDEPLQLQDTSAAGPAMSADVAPDGVVQVDASDQAPSEPDTRTKTEILNGHRETGTGVVNILAPNAIPDSGLLGKD